jgi:hypothetical protein
VLYAVTTPPADLCSFGFVLLGSIWPHAYVISACLVFLSAGDLQITNRQEHQTRTDDTRMRPHTT